jgi:hypothetical protein
MPSNANLHDGVEERVAKNPVKYAWIQTLIFQELQTHTCPGHKAAISGDLLSAVVSTCYILGFRKDNPNVFNSLIQSWPHF